MLVLLAVPLAAAACRPVDPAVAAEEARLMILDGRDVEAYARAGDAIRALDCADRWLDPDAIGSVLHAGAAAALRRGDPAQADDWLLDAARAAPGVPLNRRLGAELEARHASVRDALRDGPLVAVQARSDVRVDGLWLAHGEVVNLLAGAHYVQWRGPDGRVATHRMEILLPAIVGPLQRNGLGPAVAGIGGAALVLGGGAALWYAGDCRESLGAWNGGAHRGEGVCTAAGDTQGQVLYDRAQLWLGVGATAMGVGLAGVGVSLGTGGISLGVSGVW